MRFSVVGSILLLGFAIGMTSFPGARAIEPWQEQAPSPSQPKSPGVATSQDPPARPVQLDQLLKLPTSYRADDTRKGGATKSEWRTRFDKARGNLAEKEKKLARTRADMRKAAGEVSQWKIAPPGADVSNTDNPTNFGLTQELRRGREEVELAEKRLTGLDIEANLANVPDDWRL